MSVKCVYGMKDSDSVTYEAQFDGQLSALVSPVYLIIPFRPDLSALCSRETENPVAPPTLTIINAEFLFLRSAAVPLFQQAAGGCAHSASRR